MSQRSTILCTGLAALSIFGGTGNARTIFTTPTELRSEGHAFSLRHRPPQADPLVDHFVYTVEPGRAGDAKVTPLLLRAADNGEERRFDSFAESDQARVMRVLLRRASTKYLGLLDHLPLSRFSLHRATPLQLEERQWFIAEYELAIERGTPPTQQGRINDALRPIAEAVLVDHADLDLWALPVAPEHFPGPTDWQPTQSHLPIPITAEGVYTIDRAWIEESGHWPITLRPSELDLVQEGRSLARLILGPADASFEGGATLVFYAAGTDSLETAEGIVWIGLPEADGSTVTPTPMTEWLPDDPAPLRSPVWIRHHVEVDNRLETRMGAFLSIRRLAWIWETIPSGDDPAEVVFDLPEWSETQDGSAKLEVGLLIARVAGAGGAMILPAGTVLEVTLNDSLPIELPLTSIDADPIIEISASAVKRLGNVARLRLIGDNGRVTAHLDYLRFDGPGVPRANGSVHHVQPPAGETPWDAMTIPVAGVRRQDLLALDVTDARNPRLLSVGGTGGTPTVSVPATSDPARVILQNRRTIARSPLPKPGSWESATLMPVDADALFIVHPDFLPAAHELAQHYLEDKGLQARITTTEAIYASFSHGVVSSEAIRNFIAYAWRTAPSRRPAVVVLFGDANADGRNVARQDVPNHIPMHQLRAVNQGAEAFISTDSFYAWLTPGDELADVLVGRISVTSPNEALAVVRKVRRHHVGLDSTEYPWAVMAVADTGEFSAGLDQVLEPYPVAVRRLYADDYPWEDNYYLPTHLLERMQDAKVSPLFTADIEATFQEGAALTMFFGHGAPNIWGNQRFWFGGGTPNSDILRLRNSHVLPFVTSFTCNNAVIDYPLRPWNVCIAEDFLRHEDKGAVAVLMPSGPSYLRSHETLSRSMLDAWINRGVRGVGVLSELVRLGYMVREGVDDHSRMFILLGDPTTLIQTPTPADPMPSHTGPNLVALRADEFANEPRWIVDVRNPSALSIEGELIARLRDQASRQIGRAVLPFALGPREHALMSFRFTDADLQAGRLYGLTVEQTDRPSNSLTIHQPVIVSGGPRPALGPVMHLRPAQAVGSAPAFLIVLANVGDKTGNFTLTWHIGGDQEITGERGPLPLNSSQLTHSFVELPIDRTVRAPIPVRITATNVETGGSVDLAHLITPEWLPDLRIVPDSVEVWPEPLSDGLTIFINLMVENIGGSTSAPVSINLYIADDLDRSAPLRDMTRRESQKVPALAPGEGASIRLRHDPWRNAGLYPIRVVVDPEALQPEPDRENNEFLLPLTVLQKWKLVAGELRIVPGPEPGVVRLEADVNNDGEVDARGVTVNLYATPRQEPEDLLHSVVIPRVAPNSTTTVIHHWRVPSEAVNSGVIQPSFTVALQGSQQRVSSVVVRP